ncbi:hypothetical protein N657DRAFT_174235 [Parathielavia appendiculata]|uniref:Uncharacterized protein n=1 Tax=Parathielavia appendiculata TaxID=2587402 RepID=A0AAN6U5D6_9PEZI|nr:hypothetical protein N657DRAFT_174235 [Parathielavia appendiculata]
MTTDLAERRVPMSREVRHAAINMLAMVRRRHRRCSLATTVRDLSAPFSYSVSSTAAVLSCGEPLPVGRHGELVVEGREQPLHGPYPSPARPNRRPRDVHEGGIIPQIASSRPQFPTLPEPQNVSVSHPPIPGRTVGHGLSTNEGRYETRDGIWQACHSQ